MKKAHIALDTYVSDNFTPGDCENCHFRDVHKTEVAYQTYELKVECKLGRKAFTCPIQIHVPNQYEELGL